MDLASQLEWTLPLSLSVFKELAIMIPNIYIIKCKSFNNKLRAYH